MRLERHAADLDPALIGAMNPVQDLEDRRLAGAVSAEQRMDLAGKDFEADVVKRPHTPKGLGNAGHADSGGSGGHPTFSHTPLLPERMKASATSSVSRPSLKFGLGCCFFAIAEKKS